MRRARVPVTLSAPIVAAFTCVLAALSPADAAAQAVPLRDFHGTMRTGLGYNGSLPEAFAGAGVWHFFGSTRFGVFADAKFTTSSLTGDDKYCPSPLDECSVGFVEQERDDVVIRDEDEWLLFNIGGMYAVAPELAIMVGGGLARKTRIREYLTENETQWLTPTGTYFVRRDPEPSWDPQAVVGGLLRAGPHLAFSFGYETAPSGLTVGAYLVLP